MGKSEQLQLDSIPPVEENVVTHERLRRTEDEFDLSEGTTDDNDRDILLMREDIGSTVPAQLKGYEHADLITLEIDSAHQALRELGVGSVEKTILLGSAARRELRTREMDNLDPSDIDLLMVVDENGMDLLDQLMREPEVRLSRSRSGVGATFYLLKRPSVSGQLADTEVMISSEEGVDLQRQAPQGRLTQFVNSALNDGIQMTLFCQSKW